MVEISVIIPVYNAEKYLNKCIESILNQSFNDFEVVLIDDGSIDKSWEILQGYSKIDQRVVICSQENSGAASARNKGISIARGKYICFVDSDDYIEKDMLSKCYESIKQNNADMSICNFQIVKNDEIKILSPSEDALYKSFSYVQSAFDGEIHYLMAFTPWAKLIKKSLLTEKNILFPEKYKLSEDKIFNIRLMQSLRTVAICNYVGYIYNCDNDNSLTHNRNSYSVISNIIEAEKSVNEEFYHTLNSLGVLEKNEICLYKKQLGALISVEKLIRISITTKKEKNMLYKQSLDLVCVEKIKEIGLKKFFNPLIFAIEKKNIFLLKLWFLIKRVKQKISKKFDK